MGKLFLVATPIGNLEDITLKALRILKETTVIGAENPANSRKLFQKFELGRKQWIVIGSDREHETAVQEKFLKFLRTSDVALISDAGSIGISDPGARLVDRVITEGFKLELCPGPSSVIGAVQMTGFWQARGFTFYGFLDRMDQGALVNQVFRRSERWTHLFFLTPHRGERELKTLAHVFSGSRFCLCFELTKLHSRENRGRFLEDGEVKLEGTEILWKGECVCAIETDAVDRKGQDDLNRVVQTLTPRQESLAKALWNAFRNPKLMSPREFAKLGGDALNIGSREFYRLGQKSKS